MLLFNQQVFDEIITGTGTTWFSGVQYNTLLGSADHLLLMGYVTSVTGTSPTVTQGWEHSADGQEWVTNTVSPVAISEGTKLLTPVYGYLPYMRLRITLGGTNPSCRLRFMAAGRTL
jgi:hypothetical protein